MALTETRPETDVGPAAEPAPRATLDGLVGSADHKTIGRAWVAVGLLFLVGGTVVSALAALEAADLSGFSLVDDGDQFVQIWSLGRDLLLFAGVLPILMGLATYLVPLQVGAPAIAFPRGAAAAFWTWMLGSILLILAYVFNGGPGGGREDFVVLWVIALGVIIASLLWAMVVVATTILGARTTGMSLDRVPQTTWGFLVFCLIGLLSLPIVLGELVLVYVQARNGFLPLGARTGLTGVVDGLTLAPAVYWIAVPVLGMAVDIIGVHTRQPVRAHRPVMMAVGLFGILAYGLDFTGLASVRNVDFNHELLIVGIAAAVLPVLAVLGLAGGSLRTGTPSINPALVGALLSGLLLLLATVVSLLGLVEPVMLFLAEDANLDVDLDQTLVLNGTTFHDGVRGLVTGAVIVGLLGALHHWATKLWGTRSSSPGGFLAVLATALGAVLWALGAILAGVDDQAAYPEWALTGGGNVETFNGIALLGIALVAVGVILGALAVLGAMVGSAATDPWTGTSLEWKAASPPAVGNFEAAPVVASAFPLEDEAANDAAEED